jgi:hypothetical protein
MGWDAVDGCDGLGVGFTWTGWLHMGCGGLRGFALVGGCIAFIDTPNLFDVLGILMKLFESITMT